MNNFEDHTNYNCVLTTESGTQYRVYASWLHNQGLDNWQGWHCDAGHTRFYIDKDFNVWDGECKNTLLGNALENWNTDSNTVCTKLTCTGCTDDLITKKYKSDQTD